jgi:ribosomal-protein-alanine N-acetyltransferase
VRLRPLGPGDFEAFAEVRTRCRSWLEPWEPKLPPGEPDAARSRTAFEARCRVRYRDRRAGKRYAFGICDGDRLCGEINLAGIERGGAQSGHVGYWIDRALAGRGYVPEALVVLLRYAFDHLGLHRVEVAIVPRNERSRRVVDKLKLRDEGVAERFLQIDGVWEDHVRYAITAEEWDERRAELVSAWLT